ncbi:MAG: hypothetical protein KF716_07590 [Anaerolineae bacterium]|nr:hypothetical protein [Anaerolineae bacterium]
MRSWDEVAAYFQDFAREPRYAAFVRDMLIVVETLREHPTLGQLTREVGAGMITFAAPSAGRQIVFGWFKPKVYSAANRDADGKLSDAQFVTLPGVIGALEQLLRSTDSRTSTLPVSR